VEVLGIWVFLMSEAPLKCSLNRLVPCRTRAAGESGRRRESGRRESGHRESGRRESGQGGAIPEGGVPVAQGRWVHPAASPAKRRRPCRYYPLYSRAMPRTLWWSLGGGAVSYERGAPVHPLSFHSLASNLTPSLAGLRQVWPPPSVWEKERVRDRVRVSERARMCVRERGMCV